jgi:hypothetical protein
MIWVHSKCLLYKGVKRYKRDGRREPLMLSQLTGERREGHKKDDSKKLCGPLPIFSLKRHCSLRERGREEERHL